MKKIPSSSSLNNILSQLKDERIKKIFSMRYSRNYVRNLHGALVAQHDEGKHSNSH